MKTQITFNRKKIMTLFMFLVFAIPVGLLLTGFSSSVLEEHSAKIEKNISSLHLNSSAATIHNPARDYVKGQNPNGVWSYGYGSVGGDFILLNKNEKRDEGEYWNGNEGWKGVYCNPGKKDMVMSTGFVVKQNTMVMHPGNGKDHLAKVRFTAPADGKYSFMVKWTAIDDAAKKTNTQVFTNAQAATGSVAASGFKEVFSKGITGYRGTTSYQTKIDLKKGEVFLFEMGNGGDGYNDDALKIDLNVTQTESQTTKVGSVKPAKSGRTVTPTKTTKVVSPVKSSKTVKPSKTTKVVTPVKPSKVVKPANSVKEETVSCGGKTFKVDAAKKIYEKISGRWQEVGQRCNQLYCNRGRLFCNSTDGSVWRYSWKKNVWTQANTLLAGQDLKAGTVEGEEDYLGSANGKYFFYMEGNGDLGIWKHDPNPKNTWVSDTRGNKNCSLKMQSDGNLVVYDASGNAIWSSETHPHWDKKYAQREYKPVKLVLENDGKAVLYSATNKRIWTNVDGKL